jgi:hypothetical protein
MELRVAINELAKKCVIFFAKPVSPTGSDARECGTGFLVSYEDKDGDTFRYLVTCRHVAKRLALDFFVRLNTVTGGVELCPIEDADWAYHADETVDIAATDIGLNALNFDQLTVRLSESSQRDAVACGQRIHIIGLFRLHSGTKRNVPIVHTGHIAALADPLEKIEITDRITGDKIQVESHLVEAQTLEGLSGSPVFVQEYVAWRAQATRSAVTSDIAMAAFGTVKLFGVYQGAWDGEPGKILQADRNLKSNNRIPVGMGLVVPIERLRELIEQNETLKQRRAEIKQNKNANRATTKDIS